MDFTGLVLFNVTDRTGDLVDFRGLFLTGHGSRDLALYSFDNNSNSADQAIADATLIARGQGKGSMMNVNIVGERPSSPLNSRISEGFNKLASVKGDPVTIDIPKAASGSFSVFLDRKGKTSLEVPFDGNPGKLAGESFPGKLHLVTHSKEKGIDMLTVITRMLAPVANLPAS